MIRRHPNNVCSRARSLRVAMLEQHLMISSQTTGYEVPRGSHNINVPGALFSETFGPPGKESIPPIHLGGMAR